MGNEDEVGEVVTVGSTVVSHQHIVDQKFRSDHPDVVQEPIRVNVRMSDTHENGNN